jgi:hypothetical protein
MKKPRPDPDKFRLLKKADWLLANATKLSPSERVFVPDARDRLQRDQTLTRDQYVWLNTIYDKRRHGLRWTWSWWWWARFTRKP